MNNNCCCLKIIILKMIFFLCLSCGDETNLNHTNDLINDDKNESHKNDDESQKNDDESEKNDDESLAILLKEHTKILTEKINDLEIKLQDQNNELNLKTMDRLNELLSLINKNQLKLDSLDNKQDSFFESSIHLDLLNKIIDIAKSNSLKKKSFDIHSDLKFLENAAKYYFSNSKSDNEKKYAEELSEFLAGLILALKVLETPDLPSECSSKDTDPTNMSTKCITEIMKGPVKGSVKRYLSSLITIDSKKI